MEGMRDGRAAPGAGIGEDDESSSSCDSWSGFGYGKFGGSERGADLSAEANSDAWNAA
jgi:hypothetical protein